MRQRKRPEPLWLRAPRDESRIVVFPDCGAPWYRVPATRNPFPHRRTRQAEARRRPRRFPEPGALSSHAIHDADAPRTCGCDCSAIRAIGKARPDVRAHFAPKEWLSGNNSATGAGMTELFAPKFDSQGLLTAVCVDAADNAVLMVAFMNAEALAATRQTGFAHFHSRSRGTLWKKGETSGNLLAVEEILVDCDQDALVLRCRPAGPACHTGARSCFFRKLDGDALAGTD